MFDLNIKSIKDYKMLNRTDVANGLQRKLLTQGVDYTEMQVGGNTQIPEVTGHLGDIPIHIALTADNYQVTLEQRVLTLSEGLIIRGNIEQITTHQYVDSIDIDVVVGSIVEDMSNLSLPYSDKKVLVPNQMTF